MTKNNSTGMNPIGPVPGIAPGYGNRNRRCIFKNLIIDHVAEIFT
jgi:hypothetical protein